MGMIRRADVRETARDAVVMNLGDIAREGEHVLARARAEAERILSEASSERERLLAGAREEGRTEGFQKGLAEGRERGMTEGAATALRDRAAAIGALEKAWSEAIERVESSRLEMLAALRRDALTLAVGIGERVARGAIARDEAAVLRAMEGALEVLARPTRLVVSIHPDDEPLVREAMPGLMARFRDATQSEILCDPALERGGCIIRTDAGGSIDATIRTQIDRLTRVLLGDSAQTAGDGESQAELDGSARSGQVSRGSSPSIEQQKRSAA